MVESMEIKRDYYLDKLISRKHNSLIKIISGIRRSGKSYLLNTLFYNYLLESGVKENHIIRFAFDSADDLSLIGENLIELERNNLKVNPNKFMDYIKTKIMDNDIYYLLLDEVQMLDCFEAVLNGYLRKSNIDVYVTGSNAKFLSKDIVTEFSGRGDEIKMYPLSFGEFMSIYNGDKYEGLNEYMLYGGIPMVILRDNAEDKITTLDSLFSEIYLSDIIKRNKIRKKDDLSDLLNVVASSIGSLTNPEKLKNTFRSVKKSKITSTTVSKYLEYFEDSFLVEPSKRYDIKGKSYIDTPQKFYFVDAGLRNSRLNFRQIEQTHIMENIIYTELRRRGYKVDVGVVTVYEKDENDKQIRKQLEVDFVCNLGSKKYYIQSAYSIPNEDKRKQEIRPLKNIDDFFKKIIVTKDIVPPTYDDNGILTVSIYDLLLKFDEYIL